MRMKLTQKIMASLELPPEKNDDFVWDEEFGGFGIRLRRGRDGRVGRTFIYQYDLGSRTRRMSLGDTAVISLTTARRAAGELQARVRLGTDPAAEREDKWVQAGETMAAALKTYLPLKRANTQPRSYAEIERHLLKDMRSLHPMQLSRITPPDVATRLTAIASNAVATNVRRSLNAFFVWALGQGMVDRNPVLGAAQRPVRTRDHVIDADGLRAIWRATEDGGDLSAIVRLLLLSGARRSEIGGLRWSEVFVDGGQDPRKDGAAKFSGMKFGG